MNPSEAIPLPFTVESALTVLEMGTRVEGALYSHKQIAEWCDRFWCLYIEADPVPEVERLLPILTDVDCQWDLYLANTYSPDRLRAESFDHVALPREWFEEWLKQAKHGVGRGESDA